MKKRNIVYGLADSRNDVVYYVGKSTVGNKRPLQHLIESHSGAVNEWVRKMQDNWVRVDVLILEEVQDLDLLPERERHWIGVWGALNPDLLNQQLTAGINYEQYTVEDEEEYNNLRSCLHRIGDIMRKRRLAIGLTQSEVSERAGLSRSTISLLERNEVVNLDTIRKVYLAMEGERVIRASRLKERVRARLQNTLVQVA